MSPIVPIAITATAGAILLALRGGSPTPGSPLLMQGACGTRQYEIRRSGEGFAWKVRGDKEGVGSDRVSGTAIVTMLEFLFTNNQADVVTGHVAKTPTGEEQAGSFTVTNDGGMRWSWLVSAPGPDKSAALGSGEHPSRGAATLAALTLIAERTDWIVGLPTLAGASPQQGTVIDHIVRNGLVFAPGTVAAFDLTAWLEHARPIIIPALSQAMPAQEGQIQLAELARANYIFDQLGLRFTAPIKYSGKTFAQVLTAVRTTLSQWKAGKFLAVDDVATVIASQAIGVAPPSKGRTGRVAGKAIVVVDQFRRAWWGVWGTGNRGFAPEAQQTGTALNANAAWTAAVKAALGKPQGGIVGPAPQDQPGGQVPKCVGQVKTTSVSRNLAAASFLASRTEDIKIWTPPDAKCTRWRLMLGICLVPSGGGTFGALDAHVKNLGQGDAPAAGPDEMDFGIHRIDGGLMDWWLFKVPLAWKRQREVELRYQGGVLEIESATPIDDPSVDQCPDRARRWPGLGDDRYAVSTIDQGTKNWRSQPQLELVTQGKSLFARITYYGLPQFKFKSIGNGADQLRAHTDKTNGYTIGFKLRSEGAE